VGGIFLTHTVQFYTKYSVAFSCTRCSNRGWTYP